MINYEYRDVAVAGKMKETIGLNVTTGGEQGQSTMLAFVLIPFDPEFNGVYEDLIVPALEDVNYEVRRADSFTDQRSILHDVVENIMQADLIVAELSSVNGNVMYELGIAHGLSKPTVLLTQDITAVPFDLRSYRLITYSLNYNDVRKLQDQLREVAKRHREGTIRFGNPISDFAPKETRVSKSVSKVLAESVTPAEASSESSERLGLLDLEDNIQSAQLDIVSSLGRLTEANTELQTNIEPYTTEMIRLSSTQGTNSHKRDLARLIAAEIISYAETLQQEIPILDHAWQQFGESIEGAAELGLLVTENDRQAAKELIVGATQFERAILGVIPQISEAKGGLMQVAKLSKELNRAARHANQAFDGILSSFNIGAAYIGRVISIVQERLESTEQTSEDDIITIGNH